MDKNLEMEPRTDKKIWKTRPRADKKFEKWDLKSVGPPVTLSKRWPPGIKLTWKPYFSELKKNCNSKNLDLVYKVLM